MTSENVKRVGQIIEILPEKIGLYRELHEAAWPSILNTLSECNIHNYSIFLREPECLLFSYYEYRGSDYEADLAKIAADPETQDWWALTDPCQKKLSSAKEAEWWASMEEVFHHD